tara:strand:- start:1923 stop:2303 length:381 start_codon:yes stop_codon:yes gene_type:complete
MNELGNYPSINYSRGGCTNINIARPAIADIGKVNYKINVVNLQNKFYIQDSKQNLQFISEKNANKLPGNFIKILNTLIYFEKFKKRPIESAFYFNTENHNSVPCIDFNLLSKLQLQFATDTTYFDS